MHYLLESIHGQWGRIAVDLNDRGSQTAVVFCIEVNEGNIVHAERAEDNTANQSTPRFTLTVQRLDCILDQWEENFIEDVFFAKVSNFRCELKVSVSVRKEIISLDTLRF